MRASPLLAAILGIGLLCAMDAVIKALGEDHPVQWVTFGRYAAGAVVTVTVYLFAGRPRIGRDAARAQSARGVVIAFAALTFFYGISVLPLAEAITISFLAPLLIPFVAWAMLGETVRGRNLVAGAIGFAGVLIAVQGAPPEADTPERTWGIVAVLISAVTYAVTVVQLRGRAGIDGPVLVGMFGSVVPMLLLGPLAALTAAPPPASTVPLFTLAGLLGAGGIYLLSYAYARAEAQVLAPTEFTALGWGALYGYAFFAEVPRLQVLAGAVVIVGACLFTAWSEGRRQPTGVPPLEG
jgi:S-adenosylmethionine uptake transporter